MLGLIVALIAAVYLVKSPAPDGALPGCSARDRARCAREADVFLEPVPGPLLVRKTSAPARGPIALHVQIEAVNSRNQSGITGLWAREVMGIWQIARERDFSALGRAVRSILRGYNERDITTLSQRLYDSTAYDGGILKISVREYRALPELNDRIISSTEGALLFPFLAWVEGRGLYPLRKAG